MRSGLVLIIFLVTGLRWASSLDAVVPNAECQRSGDHFNTVLQRCSPCTLLDPRSVPDPDAAATSAASAESAIHCTCATGLVQCRAGQQCWARPPGCSGSDCQLEEAFIATSTLECRDCPASSDGANTSATSQDRTRCLPCHVGAAGDNSSTLGYSAELGDCMCPAGFALSERGVDGDYLPAKICVACAEGNFPGPLGVPSAVLGCRPCPEPSRMLREPATGVCKCRTGQTQGTVRTADFVSTGGVCVELEEFDKVNTKFPDSSAAEVTFRDLINGRESYWAEGPFGHYLGIETKGDNTLEVLGLDMAKSSTAQVTSTAIQWLYVRCAVGCMRGNTTACQCISNLCVAVLYEDQSTICRFVTRFLYEGRTSVSPSTPGHWKGMPWLFYEPQRAAETLEDTSLQWKFTFGADGNSETTNMLTLWLAQYSLEGAWLGWKKVTSELELCSSLGGGSSAPRSPDISWRRFGSSLVTKCKVSLAKLLECGAHPIFYDMFVENIDGSLVPVPVRILNLLRSSDRPNRNADGDTVANDVFVRRFTLCDSVVGKEGPPEAYFTNVQPRVFRWAAHMAMQVQTRPDTEAQIFVPILSIAYAEAETSKLEAGEVASVSFRSEYSMDVSSYWSVMTVFIVLLSCFVLALSCYRLLLVERRHPTIPPDPMQPGLDTGLFPPKPVIQMFTFLSTVFSFLFWFHVTMAMYWFVTFKGQDTPHILLPSAGDGVEYVPHDVITIIYTCLAGLCVMINLFQKLRTFVFLVDWERGAPLREGEVPRKEEEDERKQASLFQSGMNPYGGYGQQQLGQQQMGPQSGDPAQQSQYGYGSGPPTMIGQGQGTPAYNPAGQFGGYGAGAYSGQQPQQQSQQFRPGAGSQFQSHPGHTAQADFPDRGISAWRSLFIINELNERLTLTRTSSHITWLAMAALLEGFGWKNAARWYPRFDGDDAILAAQYNPILQFALATLVWLFIVVLQLLLRWLSAMVFGNTLLDFVDVCSVANVSVLFMDEPFHGYYIHGKAPTSRGEWCHSELAKALHDEGKGIGFHRGLTAENPACQTFEVFLPTDLDVIIPGGTAVKFRHTLYKIFNDINATQLGIRSQLNKTPTEADTSAMSRSRCQIQVLIDSFIHRVMRDAREIIQVRDRLQGFCGAPPTVSLLRSPIFYEDRDAVKWASCLAYGSEARLSCQGSEARPENRLTSPGFPTGFEWHLIAFELIVFYLTWRFGGSIYVAVAFAFIVNQVTMRTYALLGRRMLSRTTVINGMFLL